jgi:hypothetical protein
MKMAEIAPLAERALHMPRMESGRFTRFSENAPFGKPGVICGDQGLRPPLGMTPGSAGWGSISGII